MSYDPETAVAVVGLGIRVPGASNPDTFWRNIVSGTESIKWYERDNLLQAGVPKAIADHPEYVAASGHLDDADCFDAAFFGIAKSEADMLDPQHRLFLECCWSALEDAGYDPAKFTGDIGLFGGCFMNKYLPLNLYANERFITSPLATFARNYNDKDFLCGRVAHILDLNGPVMTVQSACSTSLVAVHLACQSLLTFECDMALAGGSSLNLPYPGGYLAPEGTMFSPEGRCRAFDANTTGTLPGNGSVLVTLRRLSDALDDGDAIRAVIIGSAVNNDGSDKASFTAPNVSAQRDVILAAQAVAQVKADQIGYMEAHGTGTRLGDPIEVAALKEAFFQSSEKTGYCALGSIKANIGHLDAGAGTAGLARAALSLQHETIPPLAGFETPNPDLNIEETPFYFPTEPKPWTRSDLPRCAAVSSFGVGGTNAHVVLAEAPVAVSADAAGEGPYVLPVSGKTVAATARNAQQLADWLESHGKISLTDCAHTLARRRRFFDFRHAVIARNPREAAAELCKVQPAKVSKRCENPDVAFMFPGVGTQYPDMALGLYRVDSGFAEDIDRSSAILEPRLGFDIRSYLFESAFPSDGIDREAVPNVVSAVFTVSHALARYWIRQGIRPTALMGHSLGEYVAATISGVLSLEHGLDLTVRRGQLFDAIPDGRMMVVPMAADDLLSVLPKGLSLAAINAPGLSALSGNKSDLEQFAEQLSEKHEISCRLLPVKMASHSSLIEPYLDEFRSIVAEYDLNEPEIPYLSCLTGDWIKAGEATDPDYWAAQLRNPVRFSDMINTITDDNRILLEVGPGRTLSSLARAQHDDPVHVVSSLRHPSDDRDDLSCLHNAAGKLWEAGLDEGLKALVPESGRCISLPTYSFERTRHWIAPDRLVGPGAPFDNPELSAVPARPPEQTTSGPVDPMAGWSERQRWIGEVWSEMLGHSDIALDDSFEDVGGHSLLAAQTLTRLKQGVQVKLDITDLYTAPTIASLAELIERRDAGEAVDGTVDLYGEIQLDDAIRVMHGAVEADPKAPVLLTGATGFLGSFLLDEILTQTDCDVHLLVRASSAETGWQRVKESALSHGLPEPDKTRCQVVCGDLAADGLGLSGADFEYLATHTSKILHCGAFVNFAQPYTALKAANVGSLDPLLRLATTDYIKPLHFVSTVFVNMGAITTGVETVLEDEPLSAPEGHDTGYTESKWVAEQICLLARERGIPVSIYRPGNILGSRQTGVANTVDYLCRVLAGSVNMGAWPRRQYDLPFGAVDDVAETIVALTRDSETLGKTFHVIQPEPLAWNDLFAALEDFGYPVEAMPWDVWCRLLSKRLEAGGVESLQPLANMLGAPADRAMPHFDISQLQATRARTGIPVAELDREYLVGMIAQMSKTGFLPKLACVRSGNWAPPSDVAVKATPIAVHEQSRDP